MTGNYDYGVLKGMNRTKTRRLLRARKKLMLLAGSGVIFQMGACAFDPFTEGTFANSVLGVSIDVSTTLAAGFVTDTIFFLLDNFLVRATT